MLSKGVHEQSGDPVMSGSLYGSASGAASGAEAAAIGSRVLSTRVELALNAK